MGILASPTQLIYSGKGIKNANSKTLVFTYKATLLGFKGTR